MGRVYIVGRVLDAFDEQAAKLVPRPRELLSHVLVSRHHVLDETNRAIAARYDNTPLELLRSARVERAAQYVVRDLCWALNLRSHSVATFIVEDTIPILHVMPDELGDVVDFGGKIPSRPQVGLDAHLYRAIQRRIEVCRLPDQSRDENISVQEYVTALVQSIPPENLLSYLNSDDFMEWRKARAGVKYRAVPVSRTIYIALRHIKTELNIPMSQMLSYLVEKDLKATEVAVSMSEGGIPEDVRKYWIREVKTLLNIDEERGVRWE